MDGRRHGIKRRSDPPGTIGVYSTPNVSRGFGLTMPVMTRHTIEQHDGSDVELFQAQPTNPRIAGALLLVHGNQGGSRKGAVEFADGGTLSRLASGLNITAAAVSQPGFGRSDGPADFCGPNTQMAIIAALSFLKEQSCVDPKRIVLYGNSRGAIASAMVAVEVSDLRALILSSGVYDLKAVFETSSRGLQQVIRRESGLSDEAFLARSALDHADRVRSETLILHGRLDDRAPVAQAEAFSHALSDAGVAVALKVFECGHRIPRDYSRAVVRAFLRKVLDPVGTWH